MESGLHFLRPDYFWLLLGFAPLAGLLWWSKRASNDWQKSCDPHLLPFLLNTMRAKNHRIVCWLLMLAWLLAVTALAGPTWKRLSLPLYHETHARVIILDLSNSMNASDIAPTRLVRAKYKVRDILKQIKAGQTGLIVYSGEPFVVSPLTEDAETILAMVPMLHSDIMPIGGDDTAQAINKATQLLKQAGAKQGDLYLLTDSPAGASAMSAATLAKAAGYRLSVLGIGSQKGAPIPNANGGFETDEKGRVTLMRLPVKSLQQLAVIGGGRYVNFSNTDKDIQQLLSQPWRRHFQSGQRVKQTLDRWQDEGHWFILPILLLALWGFRRGRFEAI